MEITAIAVSVIALGVSVIALWQTKRQADAAVYANRLHDEDRARAERAARSASLVPKVVRSGKDHMVTIQNVGQGIARDVDLAVEVPFGVEGDMPYGDWEVSGDIAAGATIQIEYILTFASAHEIQMSLTWRDGEGDREFTGRLQL